MVARKEELIAVSEPTVDDKIERLVRSVLEAVDARLADLRHEVQELAEHVAQRDADVARLLSELEQRLEQAAIEPRGAVTGADPLAARMEQATQVLLERIEAMHQRTTIATNERFANVHAAIDELRSASAAPVVEAPVMPSLDGMNAPLRMGPVTTQQPTITTAPLTAVAPPAIAPLTPVPTLEHVPVLPPEPNLRLAPVEPVLAPAPAPSPAAVAGSAAPAADTPAEGIDLGRLADLLSERLGHLDLPTRPS